MTTEAFTDKAMRRIAGIHNADSYSAVSLWLFREPEWKTLADEVSEPIIQALEAKRRDVVAKSGALQ